MSATGHTIARRHLDTPYFSQLASERCAIVNRFISKRDVKKHKCESCVLYYKKLNWISQLLTEQIQHDQPKQPDILRLTKFIVFSHSLHHFCFQRWISQKKSFLFGMFGKILRWKRIPDYVKFWNRMSKQQEKTSHFLSFQIEFFDHYLVKISRSLTFLPLKV